MLKTLRIVFAIITLVLASYGLITGNSGVVSPYMMLFMGAMLLVMGISKIKKHGTVARLSRRQLLIR